MKPDILIIGAGPAGLSAAATASELGLEALVLDEQPSPGGQIYRNIPRWDRETLALLGPDYAHGRALLSRFQKSGAGYQGSTLVWQVTPATGGSAGNARVCCSHGGSAREISARAVVLATGAVERPVPFPGWTLPGVMGVGAADANFKSSGTVPQGPVALAGSGPLLLSSAGHLIRMGVEIAVVLDTTPLENAVGAVSRLPRALKRMDYLLKGLGMMAGLARARIKTARGVTAYRATGGDRLEQVTFRAWNRTVSLGVRSLLVHEGIIPRTDFTRQLGLSHTWNPVQRYWHPDTDIFGKTGADGVYVTGDGAFVHGGIPAALKGALSALDIAVRLGHDRAGRLRRQVRARLRELAGELAPRPFVDALYRPRKTLYQMDGETLVCRCEGIRALDIRQALDEGCRDPNEIKALTRCGMGPCQGRMCGTALAEIMADYLGTDVAGIGALTIRPPVRNISLSELAGLKLLDPPAS